MRVYETYDENGNNSDLLNLAEKTVHQWRQYGNDIFEGIGAATGAGVTLANPGQPAQSIQAARISSNFLDVLGLQPALGRNFTAAEDVPGGPRVAIIGYDFWQRNLGGNPDVIGSTISLDDAPYTIVGVMPKDVPASVSRPNLVTTCDQIRIQQSLFIWSGAAPARVNSCTSGRCRAPAMCRDSAGCSRSDERAPDSVHPTARKLHHGASS